MRIVISSGHGKYIRGAAGPAPWGLDEVDEARRVVNRTAEFLTAAHVDCDVYHDDVSTTQSENLDRIVDYHNHSSRGAHDLDVSVHFNAYQTTTTKAMGTECLYYEQPALAEKVSKTIADAGDFLDRGAKQRQDLAFLRNTIEQSILIEVCFCDSKPDCDLYRQNFDLICAAIAEAITDMEIEPPATQPEPPKAAFYAMGSCSWFGGPDDTGVSVSENLAFLYHVSDAPHLFLPQQPEGTTGLARRLNPNIFYVACRWDYDVTSKEMLADPSHQAIVRAGNREFYAWPADWGPHEDTGRVADLSPALMAALDLNTDDEVEVIYPA
jgi:N-acetylmuramoyl-L-alanine amidase